MITAIIVLSVLLVGAITAMIIFLVSLNKKNKELEKLNNEFSEQSEKYSDISSQLEEISEELSVSKERIKLLTQNEELFNGNFSELKAELEAALSEKERLAIEVERLRGEFKRSEEEKALLATGFRDITSLLTSFRNNTKKCKELLFFAKDSPSAEYLKAEIENAIELLNDVLNK